MPSKRTQPPRAGWKRRRSTRHSQKPNSEPNEIDTYRTNPYHDLSKDAATRREKYQDALCKLRSLLRDFQWSLGPICQRPIDVSFAVVTTLACIRKHNDWWRRATYLVHWTSVERYTMRSGQAMIYGKIKELQGFRNRMSAEAKRKMDAVVTFVDEQVRLGGVQLEGK